MTTKLLPALDSTKQPPAPNAGSEWGEHGGGLTVLSKYSNALSVAVTDVPAERLKSVPNPWARLLLFEQALFSATHPAHRQVRGEWRAMLAAVGLARHLGLSVEARGVDVAAGSGALKSLRRMAPREERPERWDRIALLYVDGALIGGTSPRTLAFSGIRGVAASRVPFRRAGRLVDPTGHYREQRDRVSLALLDAWLADLIGGLSSEQDQLRELLGEAPAGDGSRPISRVDSLLHALRAWREDLTIAIDAVGRLSGNVVSSLTSAGLEAAFPTRHPAATVFARIRQVIPADDVGTENDLRVVARTGVAYPGATGVITKAGQPYTGDIALPRGMGREVRNGRFVLPTSQRDLGATLPDFGELFEQKLIPVSGASPRTGALEIGGQQYLVPLRQEALQTLTIEDLIAWTKASGERATGITVRLELPLTDGMSVRYEHRYVGSDVYDAEQVPTALVSVWPDFESDTWENYFYVERQAVARGSVLTFEPWTTGVRTDSGQSRDGLRWGRLTRPARAWVGRYGQHQGILPVRPAELAPAGALDWDIAVDFGSTHTRVFQRSQGTGGTPVLREVHLSARARSITGSDTSLPYTFFVDPTTLRGPDVEAPSLIWLPLDHVVEHPAQAWMPDQGVIYWGALDEAPQTVGLRGNLKWHRDDAAEKSAFSSYVSQLFLMVAAEAAASGARVRTLTTAYPSVLPSELRTRHRNAWRELETRFPVRVLPPRSESDALASYFVVQGGAAIEANLLAVDVGGSTSDLTVWLGGRRAHGDSVRLAGDLLSRLVASDATARVAIDQALRRPPFNRSAVRWDEGDPTKNGLILNSILRTLSQDVRYSQEPDLLAQNIYDGPGSAGERVLAHLGYLFATVGFLLGLLVRREGTLADRYDLRFAGRGSEFLHWLEALSSGASRSVVAAFFRAGLGAQSTAIVEVIPPGAQAKQEVGRGLLLEAVGDVSATDDRTTFVGETVFSSAAGPLPWSSVLSLETLRTVEKPGQPLPLDRFESLRDFVKAFDSDPAARKIARALGISDQALDLTLRDQIHNQLFGPQSAWQAAKDGNGARLGEALLEPAIVTEAKALLMRATNNYELFR